MTEEVILKDEFGKENKISVNELKQVQESGDVKVEKLSENIFQKKVKLQETSIV